MHLPESLGTHNICFLGESLAISSSSNSDAAFNRIESWFKHCLAEDEGCRVQNTNFIPRRLVNVGSIDNPHVFLVELQEPAQYVGLSYCWGTNLDGVVTTTTSNLSKHFRDISLQSLPQTIQDAIAVCRATKMQYVWVDALCIIQDDGNDWETESAQMLNIYANSTFTIAVSEPDWCKKGFLGPQKYGSPTWQRSVETTVPAALGGPSNRIYIRTSDPTQELDYRLSAPISSLAKRGWCLQEAILPNRVVYFDGKELVWQCLQRTICECGHSTDLVSSIYAELKVGLGHGKCSDMSYPPFNLYRSWENLLREYSLRHLTQATDKLVAISGLARLFSRATHGRNNSVPNASTHSRFSSIPENINRVDIIPGDYCAGLWKNRFIQGLSWNVGRKALHSTGRSQHTRQLQYCAPTWSWASIDGPVEYLYEIEANVWKYTPAVKEHSQLLDVSLTYMNSENCLGPVISGYVMVNGPIIPILIHESTQNEPLVRGDTFSEQEKPFYVQGEHAVAYEVILDVHVDLTVTEKSSEVETQTALSDTLYYSLRLFSWVDSRGPSSSRWDRRMSPEMWFLVLKKRPEKSGAWDVFERLGVGMINTRRNSDSLFQDAVVKIIKLV